MDTHKSTDPIIGGKFGQILKCPTGMDESVFRGLPLHIQQEILTQNTEQQQQQQQQQRQEQHPAGIADEAVRNENCSFQARENFPQNCVDFLDQFIESDSRASTRLTPPGEITATPLTTKCDGIDPEILAALPEDVRREVMVTQMEETEEEEQKVIARYSDLGCTPESKKVTIRRSTNYDPEVLQNLPGDIRFELLTLGQKNSQTWDGENSQTWNGENSKTWDLLPQVKPKWDRSSFILAGGCSDKKSRQTMPAILQIESEDGADGKCSRNQNFSPTKTPKRHTTAAAACLSSSLMPQYGNREQSSQEEACVCHYTGERDRFGQRTGQGELRWENGDKFNGLFVDGARDGPGKLWLHDGSTYEGNWKNDQYDGYGVRKFPSGYVYAGYFQSGRSHGHGKCEFPSGDKYEGDWYDGLMDGLGKYVHKQNGDVYEGMFRAGKRDGPGRYRYKNRRTDVIRYSNGERVGEGVRWSKDGKKAWLLSGKEVIGKLSKEAAQAMQDRICGADIKIMDDNILLHHRECAIHTSPMRKKIPRQQTCRVPHIPNV